MDRLVANLRVLWRAEQIVAEIRLRALIARTGLIAFAGLIAVFGLGMLNLAGYLAAADAFGPVGGAVVVAAVDFLLALTALLVALRTGGGRDLQIAGEVRDVAFEALMADARALEAELLRFRAEFGSLKGGLAGLIRHPLDGALAGLVVPLAGLVLKHLRAARDTPPG